MMRSPLSVLKAYAKCMGAKVKRSLYFALLAGSESETISEKNRLKAYKAGEELA